MTRHPTGNSDTSRQLPTSIDLPKALELIRYVGCETHHQVRAALQMLIPYIETEQAATPKVEDTAHDFAAEGTCTSSSSIAHVDHAICSVVEMYVEKKLASRTKREKDSNKGRLEVGRKLKVIEDEVGLM